MNSVWHQNTKKPEFQTLSGNTKTNVLIIGGGIAGILCAKMLKDANVDYLLIDSDEICGRITKNTTAKITVQHGLIYSKLFKKYGTQKTRLYYEANFEALNKYKKLCNEIKCDFETKDSYVYSLNNSKKIESEIKVLNEIGAKAEFCTTTSLPFEISAAVKIKSQAQFNPLKFLYTIAQGLNIKEHTKAIEITSSGVKTNNGFIKAEKIIVATHFPIFNKHGSYFLKMYQHRSYVIALENAENVDGMYVDENDKGLSFRNYGDYLLLGGGSHRTGKSGGNWKELKSFANRYYPNSIMKYQWATQDCMSLDRIAYIGQYSANTPNLYVATGFNKWGMTTAMVAANILKDLIVNNKSKYSELFSPSRSIITPQLAINATESLFGLLKPVSPRCPHMGCALKYNKAEHTWDCSCHGSRFSKEGHLIDNPATDDIKKHLG